jgi:beta-aspartyl-peptidase (threonine type)
MTTPQLIVHGGAGQWLNFDEEAVQAGVRAAAERGWSVLHGGGTALEAVEAATIVLEDHPLFDAGFGSFINQEGEVEMDALLCDGASLTFGAVAAVRRVKNPITLARLVMTRTPHHFFAAEGADQLAARLGLPIISNIELITEKEFVHYRTRHKDAPPRAGLGTGTVGAVAIDAAGNLASATSTGGTPDKPKGRIGDSPVYGAGGYARNGAGACSTTGQGEHIMRVFLSKEAADRMQTQSAPDALRAAADFMAGYIPNPDMGIIGIDGRGNLGAFHTTRAMPIAWVKGDGVVKAAMRWDGSTF